jgi:outer membrane protein OmpA-like peptidoglycan-associated protein
MGNHDYSTNGPGSREVNAVLISEPVADIVVTEAKSVYMIKEKVLFAFDKSIVDVKGLDIIKNVAALLKTYPDTQLVLKGHTDKYGADNYNMTLSQKRAEAVRAEFEKLDLANRIDAVLWFGETELISKIHKENRRVLILSVE